LNRSICHALEAQPGDDGPPRSATSSELAPRFPVLPQRVCWITHTTRPIHDTSAPTSTARRCSTGRSIPTAGPRYCPSIEDKVVRFADRASHHVFLEPESAGLERDLLQRHQPRAAADVQDVLVRAMPGCERAEILRYGYAVEYDMVWPHQIDATGMTKRVPGLFLAGQINGTSGYEEAAAQGLVAGVNAARSGAGGAYEPFRRSRRGVHRRADGRPGDQDAARAVPHVHQPGRAPAAAAGRQRADRLTPLAAGAPCSREAAATLHAEAAYEGYIVRQRAEVRRRAELERRALPAWLDFGSLPSLRTEAREALERFRPATFGQASRLEGLTPADITLLAVLVNRAKRLRSAG
jgi:tRNA uridine 5-carboxymethylaminomethyl modification enzyme